MLCQLEPGEKEADPSWSATPTRDRVQTGGQSKDPSADQSQLKSSRGEIEPHTPGFPFSGLPLLRELLAGDRGNSRGRKDDLSRLFGIVLDSIDSCPDSILKTGYCSKATMP